MVVSAYSLPLPLTRPSSPLRPAVISSTTWLLVTSAFHMPRSMALFRKAARSRRPVASLTKVMTALVALRAAAPEDRVTVTPAAVFGETILTQRR